MKMTHNEYMAFMKENANRLYSDREYTWERFEQDSKSVEILDYDLERFHLSFSDDQMKLINLFFTEERVNDRGRTLLEGHMMNDGAEYRVANTLGINIVATKGLGGFGVCHENRCIFSFCEGDIYLTLCQTEKEYREEMASYSDFYGVRDLVSA